MDRLMHQSTFVYCLYPLHIMVADERCIALLGTEILLFYTLIAQMYLIF
jgi:hypothetical protein